MTQEELVLQYIKDFGSISTLEAFKDLGITRLSAKIFNLRRDYNVRDVWDEVVNRYGKKVKFKRYFLDRKTQPIQPPKQDEKPMFHTQAEEWKYYHDKYVKLAKEPIGIVMSLDFYKQEVEKLEKEFDK